MDNRTERLEKREHGAVEPALYAAARAVLNRLPRAAETPVFSEPAMGWLPTKNFPVPRVTSSPRATIDALVLPTSVITAPAGAAFAAASARATAWTTSSLAKVASSSVQAGRKLPSDRET